ncbi:MAG TPA: hypothetical protein VIU82_01825 [Bosea sp. (in: a-proteobacteria)]
MPDMTSTIVDLAAARDARQVARQRQAEAARSDGQLELAEGLYAALGEASHLSPSSRAAALLSAAMLELREDQNASGDVAARGHELLRAVTVTLARKGELVMSG